jgi:hypothetical protein
MTPALQWNLASKLHFRESPIAPSHARMLPTAHDHTELEQSLGVVAWLEEGRDLGDDPRRSPRSDNGPLSLPSVIVFHAAHQNASRLSPAHLGEAGMLSGRTRMPLTVWFTACRLFAPATDGISALSLRRAVEIGSHQGAPDSSWRALCR